MMWRAVAVVLAAITAYAVFRAGILHAAMFTLASGAIPVAWSLPNIQLALWYTVPVLVILLAHEVGHMLMARSYGVDSIGPFLLPGPTWIVGLPVVGSLGAFVRFQSGLPSKVAQWDVTASGLLAGAAASLLCILLGAAWSIDVATQPTACIWEPSIIQWLTTANTAWHPLLTAGWVGACLTIASLIPIPPMDGWRMLDVIDVAWRERRLSVVGVGAVVLGCLA